MQRTRRATAAGLPEQPHRRAPAGTSSPSLQRSTASSSTAGSDATAGIEAGGEQWTGWWRYRDLASGLFYFFHPATQQTTWTQPSDAWLDAEEVMSSFGKAAAASRCTCARCAVLRLVC